MPIEHPSPTEATVKYLYAHAFGCAYQSCRRPLYRVDEQTGARTLNSRVCHIHARREGGPRWDPDQAAEDNRSEQNLVLMCTEHASAIDDPTNLSAYPAELLRAWKAKQVEVYDKLRQGWIIDDEMARDAIRASFSNVEIAVNASTVNLGGEGGKAPAAGGGGGGVIGTNATGGRGGPGGNINLDGTPGEAPGAGGGGAGASGERAVGGEGGAGGEYVSVTLGPDDMGFHHFEIQVGKGGVGGKDGGGGPGEDSIVNLCDEHGHVLRSVVARGGRAGATPYIPPAARSPTDEDVTAGLKVAGILAATFMRRDPDGLWTIVDGGWDWLKQDTNPFRVSLPLLIEIATGTIAPATILNLKLIVRNPDGFQVHEQGQTVAVEDSLVRRSRIGVVLEFSGSQRGLWHVQVLAGGLVIGDFPIEIRVPTHE